MSDNPPPIEASNKTVRRSKWATASIVFVAVATLLMLASKALPFSAGWDNLGRDIMKGLLWLASCLSLLLAVVCCLVAARKDQSRRSEVLAATLCCAMAPMVYFVAYHWWPTPELLVIGAADNDLATVKRCLAFGIDVNVESPHSRHPFASKRTALVAAVGQGHKEMTELLLKRGADPNRRDSSGRFTIESARSQIVIDLLVKAGADGKLAKRFPNPTPPPNSGGF